jgi:hypothetical protein
VAGREEDREERHQASPRFTTPETTVATGNTAFGTGSLERMLALPRRLFIEATIDCEKKFQNRIPASA